MNGVSMKEIFVVLFCGVFLAVGIIINYYEIRPIKIIKELTQRIINGRIGIESGFIDSKYGIVKDDVYNLIWQDNQDIYKASLSQAIKYCDELDYAGYNDWRLPTVNELLSITDDDRHSPAVNSIFNHTGYEEIGNGKLLYGLYWSSTKYKHSFGRAWLINFDNGENVEQEMSYYAFVRCVRQY